MTHTAEDPRRVRVDPPLDPDEIALLRGLAGVGEVRPMWPGQPSPRSPWLPCGGGCCLVPGRGTSPQLARWMRFLLREVLAPRGAASVRRATERGLPGGHLLEGQVEVRTGAVTKLVVVRRNRVHERARVGSGQRTER